ncbi:MAG: hypothetical protein SO132_02185 [Candidatus Enteromonas sp.]|nr:hypothetical protein [Candidatus Enteromonas sp.]
MVTVLLICDRGNLYLAKREYNIHQFGQHSQNTRGQWWIWCFDTICCNDSVK